MVFFCRAKKIVLRCKNAEHLFDIKDIAVASGLKYAQICDAGLTQVSIYMYILSRQRGETGMAKVNKLYSASALGLIMCRKYDLKFWLGFANSLSK